LLNMLGQITPKALSGEELFRLRMESQCQQIKRYRLEVLGQTGRLLSPDQAAMQWIDLFAESFEHPITD
jgi:hypothetical protein